VEQIDLIYVDKLLLSRMYGDVLLSRMYGDVLLSRMYGNIYEGQITASIFLVLSMMISRTCP
jgi:hypothetical protein